MAGRSVEAQCIWKHNVEANRMTCNIRALDGITLDLQPAQKVDSLYMKCTNDESMELVSSNVDQHESELPKNVFVHLQNLNELVIDSCKLHRIPRSAFAGLRPLKHLKIQTRHPAAGASVSDAVVAVANGIRAHHGHGLEVNVDSFGELKELETLNLAENNLHAIPEGTFCELTTLQVLNVSRNRIRFTEHLGFPTKPCTVAGGGELDLRVLDLSRNELMVLPENWTLVKFRRLQQLNLEHNNLAEISGEALAGLPSLHIFNISYNELRTLPSGLFAGARDFQEIHLQHNKLMDLPRGIFHKLEQLLILDLSHNNLSNNHIDNSTFSGLIRLIVLNLSQNMLNRLDSKTFRDLYFLQILDLRNNSINQIDDNTFLPLYNLHTLNLAENQIHTISNNLFNGLFVLSKLTLNSNRIRAVESAAFRNCSDLKELDLSTNQLTGVPEGVQNLTMLRTLDLGENEIKDILPGAFQNLNQLTGLRLIDNYIGNLSKYMFVDLPRLNVLNLAKNRIQLIERGTFDRNGELEALRLDRNFIVEANGVFTTLNSLLWLNLGENHLVWFDYAFIPSNLKWLDLHGNYIEELGNYYKLQDEQINVKTLDVSHNRITEIGPMSLPNSIELLFINNNLLNTLQPNTFVDKRNLSRVDLYSNLLQKVHLHTLRLAPYAATKPLPEFYMSGNPFECDCSMDWLLSINNMSGRQHPRLMDQTNIECIIPSERTPTTRPLTSLTVQDFLCPYKSHCFTLCQCCEYVACDCEMICPENCTCYHDQTWSANVVDCGHSGLQNSLPKNFPIDTTVLYLDKNIINDVESTTFIGRKNLRRLYLNDSHVSNIQKRAFGNLHLLEVLHLDHNHLRSLHGHEFDNLLLLRQLYLHSNQIEHISNETFTQLQALQVLRIDGNRIVSMGMFPKHLPPQNLHQLRIGQNPWSCACSFLRELTRYVSSNALIIEDAGDIYCVEGQSRRELDFNSTVEDCNGIYEGRSVLPDLTFNKHITLLVAMVAFIVMVACIVLVIVFQASIRVWLFAKCGVRICETIAGDCEKLYDALILYSEKDFELVTNEIAGELEIHPPQLRLCLQHRDLTHDATYLQILESARASKRVVLLLSRNFLQTEWTRYEVRNAVHEALKDRVHKLVLLNTSDAQLEAENDLEMLPYIKSRVVNTIKLSDKHFWEKMRYALPAEVQQRCNNYTLHQHHTGTMPTTCDRIPKLSSREECMDRPGLPLYYHDGAEANYSSATTATPSPLGRRGVGLDATTDVVYQHQPLPQSGHSRHQRPPSEHIYFSIDSDYNAEAGESSNDALVAGTANDHFTFGTSEGQQWRILGNAGKSTLCAQQPYMV